MRNVVASILVVQVAFSTSLALGQSAATALRVASIALAKEQPQRANQAVIFYEDFEQLPDWRTRFFEYTSEKESFIWAPDAGLHGGAMCCQFEKGQVSAGSLKVLFGKNPFGRGTRQGEDFRDAVFLENYWNQGSVKRQARWFDNFAISTQPIGPITASKPPVISRTPSALNSAWEVEVATDPQGRDIVWKSRPTEASSVSLTVDGAQGSFTGSCSGKSSLDAGAVHWIRIKEEGQSEWSPWHVPFH